MIKNTYIPLTPASSLRNDAANTIKYTLLLDYHLPDETNKLIPAIMESCHKCCQGLFQNDSPINFNFFGLTSSNKPSKNDCLAFLDEYPALIGEKREEIGFPTMILDHCILSCYHAILTDLLQGEKATSYMIENGLENKSIYSLYLTKRLNILPEKGDIKRPNITSKTSKSSSKSSDFVKSTKTHLRALPHLESLLADKDSPPRYSLQFSWLLYQVCKVDARRWRILSLEQTKEKQETILEKFEALSQEISPKKAEKNFSFVYPADDLYAYYIKERIFNFNLVYSLLRNIHRIEKETNFRLCQKEILSALSTCQKLPNVFSRQYFLHYAFDKLLTQPISYLDFWHDHRLDMGGNVLEPPPKYTNHFQFTTWIEQFSHFCNYMAEFVIPIYEWCFTSMLMEAIEQKFPDKTHEKHLEEALKVLSKYMGDNYMQIVRPIKVPGRQELLDIITPHKGVMELEYPAGFLKQLLNEFCSTERELDLNLTPLTPDFFRSGGNKKIEHSRRQIRNFYTNLLHP